MSMSLLKISLSSRISINVQPKLILIQQCKAISSALSSTQLSPPTPQHIAQLIHEQKSATQALETFKWAFELPNFTHNQSTYQALIHKLCTFRRFDCVHNLLDEMPNSIGTPPNEDIFVTIVRGLGQAQRIRDVIKVLDLVHKFGMVPTLKVYNSILNALVKEDIDIAREFFRKKMMECGVQGDDYTYGILMKGLCLTNRIRDGFKLLQVMKTRGLTPNTTVYNTLLHALCRNGKVGRARSLMSEMVDPNDVTFNLMISAYCEEKNLVQAQVLLEKSISLGFVPDVVPVTKVIELLCNVGRASEAAEILDRAENYGGVVDTVAYNTLIKGFCRLGKAKVGLHFKKQMENKGCLPNVDTYNNLIAGFCDIGLLDSAVDLFNEMKSEAISCNYVTYDTLIRGFCCKGLIEDALEYLGFMEESKGGCRGCISPYNSIIYGLYCDNRLDEALEFLNKMNKLFPRAVDRTLRILNLCKEENIESAKKIYDQMIHEGKIPSAIVYSCLIHGFCQHKQLREAIMLMNDMACRGYYPVTSTYNVVISGFCNQGNIIGAVKLAEDMVARGCLEDVETYSPLIHTLCSKGELQKALKILQLMMDKGIMPDCHAWNCLLGCVIQETPWSQANSMLLVNSIVEQII